MTIDKAKEEIKKAGGSWDTFNEWMRGQTVGLNEDGTTNLYDYDVERFIRYKCNPKNEPTAEFD